MIHDLIKHGPRQYECTVCQQYWKAKPRNACPGVKVYDKGDYGLLFTKRELETMGYRTDEESLPPRIGCFYKHASGQYVALYDPIYAIPKMRRGNPALYTTQIWWPLRWLPMLEMLYFYEMRKERDNASPGQGHRQLQSDVANMAASTLVFTRSELEQINGYVLEFTMPSTPIHRIYPFAGRFTFDEYHLVLHLLTAYRKHQQNTTYV
jgi:hypothetical protein